MDEIQRKAFEAGRNGGSMPRDLGFHILDSGTTFSAIMDIRAEQEKSSFVVETQDMSIIERYRVTVERVD
jgi:hypothetical protein